MGKGNMGLDGYYPCTIIRKVARIGQDRTEKKKVMACFSGLIYTCVWIIVLGELLHFLYTKPPNLKYQTPESWRGEGSARIV